DGQVVVGLAELWVHAERFTVFTLGVGHLVRPEIRAAQRERQPRRYFQRFVRRPVLLAFELPDLAVDSLHHRVLVDYLRPAGRAAFGRIGRNIPQDVLERADLILDLPVVDDAVFEAFRG